MNVGDPLKLYNPKALQQLIASQEAQAYAMVFLSFFALAFFTIFAIRPTLSSFFSLRKQIQDAEAINVKLDEKINTLLAAQQTYQAYQQEIALLEKALPADPQLAQLIQKLEDVINEKESTTTAFSTNDQVTLLDLSPVAAPPTSDTESADALDESTVESVSFSLAIASDYKNNESVLQKLLNLKRIISLTELQFTTTSDTESNQEGVDTTLSANAYYLPKESRDQ